MEVCESGKTITIKSSRKFPIKTLLLDATSVLFLVWGVFTVLVVFFSQTAGEILLYFVAITLLLIVPLVIGILLRQTRQYEEILFNGEIGILAIKGVWRRYRIPLNAIKELQIKKYRYKQGIYLYRLEAIRYAGKTLKLVRDVPEIESIKSLGKKLEDLIKRPLRLSDD